MAQVVLDISTRTPDAALGRTGQKLRSLMQDTVKTSKETEKLGKLYKTLEKGMTQLKAGFASLNSGLSKMTILTGGTSLALGNLIHSSWDMGKRIMEMRAEMKHLSDTQGNVNQAWGVAIKAWSAPGTLASLQTIKGVMNGLAQSGMQVGGAMADLTKFLGDVHQASGLSIDSIAKLTGEMHSYWGVSTKGAREVVSSVLAAQKAFGATTAQMEQMIGVINKAQSNLGAFFKDGEKGSKALAKGITVASGAMMKLGINAQTATDFMDKLLDPERYDETSALLRRLGITIDDQIKMMESAEGKNFFFDKLLENLPKLSREIQAIQNPFARISYAKALGLPAEIAAKMANASTSQMRGLIEEYKAQAEGEKAAEEKRTKAQADAQRIEEQMMFLKMKILGPMINFVMDMYGKIMKSGLMEKASNIMQRIVGVVAGFLKVFEPVIDLLAGNTKEIGPALISMAKGAFEFIHKQITVLYEKLKPYLIQFMKEAVGMVFKFIKDHPFITLLVGGGLFLKFKNSIFGFSMAMKDLIGTSKLAIKSIIRAAEIGFQRIALGKGPTGGAADLAMMGMGFGPKSAAIAKTGRFAKLAKFGKFAPLAILGAMMLPGLLSKKKEDEEGEDVEDSKTNKMMNMAGTGMMAAQFGPGLLRGAGGLASKVGIKGGAGIAAKMGAMAGMKAIPIVGWILSALLGAVEGAQMGQSKEFVAKHGRTANEGEKVGMGYAGAITLGIGPLIDKIFKTQITEKFGGVISQFADTTIGKILMPQFQIFKMFADKSLTAQELEQKEYWKNRLNNGKALSATEQKEYDIHIKKMASKRTSFYDGVMNIVKKVKDFLNGIQEKIVGIAKFVKTKWDNMIKSIKDFFSKSIPEMLNSAIKFVKDLPNTIKNLASGAWEKINSVMFSALDKIGTIFEKIKNWFEEKIGLPAFKAFFGIELVIRKMVTSIMEWVGDSIGDLPIIKNTNIGRGLKAMADQARSESSDIEELNKLYKQYGEAADNGPGSMETVRGLKDKAPTRFAIGKEFQNYMGVQIRVWERDLKSKAEEDAARRKNEEAQKKQQETLENINRSAGLGADYQRQTVEQLKGKELKETDFLQTFLGSYGAVSLSTRTS